MRGFMMRMAAVLCALGTVLLVDAVLMGALSVWGGLALLPLCAMLTAHFFRKGLAPKRRARHRTAKAAAGAHRLAPPPPALRVAPQPVKRRTPPAA